MFDDLVYRAGKLYRNNKEVGWFNKSNGYRMFQYKGKKYLTHRVIWYICKGRWPSKHIDHKDQNRLNNLISNLRDVTRSVNLRNQKKIKGYYRCNGRWRAMMSVGNKMKHIGMFDTKAEARAAYLAAIAQLEE